MTTENVVKSIGRGNLIHFATHGVLDNRHPLFSGLLLSDGIISVSSIFSLDLRANLVVLSACNTGIGELSSGDEIVGMTRAFMYAGAPTIVATLWSVSDESTALLMKSFYENLQKDEPATVALRHAQLSLMEKYPEPFYWAPFFVTGK
jgi:CHAT domain-containing protein